MLKDILEAWSQENGNSVRFYYNARSITAENTPLSELFENVLNSTGREQKKATDNLVGYYSHRVERGNVKLVMPFYDNGFPVNFKIPPIDDSVLHVAAAHRARPLMRELLQRTDIDYLTRDKKGRLASEMAFVYGEDVAMARLLRIKERKQADKLGIRVTRRPAPSCP